MIAAKISIKICVVNVVRDFQHSLSIFLTLQPLNNSAHLYLLPEDEAFFKEFHDTEAM